MNYNTLIFEIENGVGMIRLNRPDNGNAIIPEMTRELLDVAIRWEYVLRWRRSEGFCRPS